jgi:hypothetical protein
MDLHQALDDLLDVHAERIQRLLRRQVTERFKLGEEDAIGLQLEWGMVGPPRQFLLPGFGDEILFLRAIVLSEGALFPCYIPVRDIDFDKELFTDKQLCRKKPLASD